MDYRSNDLEPRPRIVAKQTSWRREWGLAGSMEADIFVSAGQTSAGRSCVSNLVLGVDDHDWGEFFARYEAMAVRFARGLTHDPHSAADLFQEAARAVCEFTQDGRRFASPAHARNYLFKVIRNLAIDANRAPRSAELDVEPTTTTVGGAQLAERRERGDALRRALADLPPTEREALNLRFDGGLSYREIADRTRTSVSTLQARVESALEKIRQRLGKSIGAE